VLALETVALIPLGVLAISVFLLFGSEEGEGVSQLAEIPLFLILIALLVLWVRGTRIVWRGDTSPATLSRRTAAWNMVTLLAILLGNIAFGLWLVFLMVEAGFEIAVAALYGPPICIASFICAQLLFRRAPL